MALHVCHTCGRNRPYKNMWSFRVHVKAACSRILLPTQHTTPRFEKMAEMCFERWFKENDQKCFHRFAALLAFAIGIALGSCITLLRPSLVWDTQRGNLEVVQRLREMQRLSEMPPQGQHVDGVGAWKKVMYFKGDTQWRKFTERWTSQVGQDRTIVDIFDGKRGGYFVDLAANDAVTYSNTLTLEQELGWTGLCVEPNPLYLQGLLERRCDLAVAATGRRTGEEVRRHPLRLNLPCFRSLYLDRRCSNSSRRRPVGWAG